MSMAGSKDKWTVKEDTIMKHYFIKVWGVRARVHVVEIVSHEHDTKKKYQHGLDIQCHR